jgi:1-deoxy-D-xylulose-5-phosphate reductoisomerase
MSENKRIRIAVIGATGSVGGAVLDICARFPERFDVVALAAHSNSEKLIELARKHHAQKLCLTEPVGGNFKENGFDCISGTGGLSQISTDVDVDHVVFASSGTSAIEALQGALINDKDVSLANKESIVVAGPWVMPLVKRPDQLRPIDSEHSAVWQCLRDAPKNEVNKVWLTASGGPFRNYTIQQMANVKPSDALNHPVWKMGEKVTIDSATLMNKGIECIEAMQLFGLHPNQVSALIHPRSQVHGLVQFYDGTVKMLLSHADMRLPSAAAIAWPMRLDLLNNGFEPLEPGKWNLDFSEIDDKLFPCFAIARKAAELGGAYPALLVGADEAVVTSFLGGHLQFLDIAHIVNETLSSWKGTAPNTLADAISLVEDGKRIAGSLCKKGRHIYC